MEKLRDIPLLISALAVCGWSFGVAEVLAQTETGSAAAADSGTAVAASSESVRSSV